MRWVNCSEGLPSNYIVNTYFVKQRMKGSDEDWFPGVCTYSRGHDSFSWEWEISEDYEVIEWLDENDNEIERNAVMINEINNSLNQEIEKQIRFKTEYKEMYKNACGKVTELEKENEIIVKFHKKQAETIGELQKENDVLRGILKAELLDPPEK